MKKENIANICEDLYKYCISIIPQVEKNKLIWIMNGSTLCNMLYNVEYIDDEKVSKEFNDSCYKYIRQPKGDIDITYTEGRKYKFDLSSDEIKKYQSISKEQRTYNFIDHNSILCEDDLKQICKMTTKNGFTFYAKKPQYLFLYKFKELLAVHNKEILNNDIKTINKKQENIIKDFKNLYYIALSYCGKDGVLGVLEELPNLSNYFHKLYKENKYEYNELLNSTNKLL